MKVKSQKVSQVCQRTESVALQVNQTFTLILLILLIQLLHIEQWSLNHGSVGVQSHRRRIPATVCFSMGESLNRDHSRGSLMFSKGSPPVR